MYSIKMLLGVVLLCLSGTYATCPHAESGMTTLDTSGLTETSNVSITSVTLLNSNMKVAYIDISGTGKLVFNQGVDIKVEALGIMVRENGSLIIGSGETGCRITNKIHIILRGERIGTSAPEGQKYIAVKDFGTLQIYGKEIRHLTQLDASLERFNINSGNVKYEHQASSQSTTTLSKQGLAVYIFGSDYAVKSYQVFDLWKAGDATSEDKEIGKLKTRLDEAVDGDIVCMAIQNYFMFGSSTNISDLYQKLEQASGLATNSLYLRREQKYDAFAILYVKGGSVAQAIDYNDGKLETHAEAALDVGTYKISAISHLKVSSTSNSYVDFRILDEALAYPIINVTDSISSWNQYDEVLIASSDYSYLSSEVRGIKEKLSDYAFRVDRELNHRHLSLIENKVDMRVEVVLLTRNILVEGLMSSGCPTGNENCDDVIYDSFGAHIKIFDFNSVHIEGLQMKFAGQATDKGFYPIHFHMCKDVSGKEAELISNSITHSYARAFTIHGTFGNDENNIGVLLKNNVAYHILGHAYFLEDGIERYTVFDGNFVSNVLKVKNGFATDNKKPSGFWITNPLVKLVNNRAAGGEGWGIWYTFPIEPVGPSTALNNEYDPQIFAPDEARHTPLWTFDSNTVHSNHRGGYNFDNILLNENGDVAGCMNYASHIDPLDTDSEPVKVQIVRLTAWKNTEINIWIRGGYFEIIQLSAAESKRGVQLARASAQQPFVTKSIITGRSAGNYEEVGHPNYVSIPFYLGVVFYDGPVYISETSFFGFKSSDDYVSGALGFKPKNVFSSSAASETWDLRFGFLDKANGNRVFDGEIDEPPLGFGNFEGDRVATFRDRDGTVSKCPDDTSWTGPQQIVKPQNFLITSNCKFRDNWNMVACSDLYGKIKTQVLGVFSGEASDYPDSGHMRRVLNSSSSSVNYETHTGNMHAEYMVILGEHPRTYYYEYQLAGGNATHPLEYPRHLRFTAKGVERNLGVVLGICLPAGATIDHLTLRAKMADGIDYSHVNMWNVDSIDAVSSSTHMDTYHIDGRMLYMKVETFLPRLTGWSNHDTDHCPQGQCPLLEVKINQTFDYTPCHTPTAEQLDMTTNLVEAGIENITCDFPLASPAYESNWGVGEIESAHDGGWGLWTEWTSCCSGATSTSRKRACDNPPQKGTGAACSGDTEESKSCDSSACPVDGVWNTWSRWSHCFCDAAGISYGIRTRTRQCEGLANYGKACQGALEEMKGCKAGCQYT